MNSNLLLVILVIILSVVAPLLHLVIAYVVAPRRSKEGILDALVSDTEFQGILVATLMKNLMTPVQVKLPDGQDVMQLPIDPLLRRAITGLEDWIKGKQGKMVQEMTQKASGENMNVDNPIAALALSSIPKKYQWIVNLALKQGIIGTNQESSGSGDSGGGAKYG
jgi:hypothetical protein